MRVIAETTAARLERELELDVLQRALVNAAQGDGSVVVIQAPAGLGKTRRVQTAAEAAERAGLRALHARGSELERRRSSAAAGETAKPVRPEGRQAKESQPAASESQPTSRTAPAAESSGSHCGE
jgi:hypothetical protein